MEARARAMAAERRLLSTAPPPPAPTPGPWRLTPSPRRAPAEPHRCGRLSLWRFMSVSHTHWHRHSFHSVRKLRAFERVPSSRSWGVAVLHRVSLPKGPHLRLAHLHEPPPRGGGGVVTVVLSLRSSPTHAMEALRHEHERDLVEVKGIAVWILNVLVDATRHRWRNGNSGPKQRLGGPSLKEREGKGSEWRSASGHRQLQTRTQYHGFLPNPPPPRPGFLCFSRYPAPQPHGHHRAPLLQEPPRVCRQTRRLRRGGGGGGGGGGGAHALKGGRRGSHTAPGDAIAEAAPRRRSEGPAPSARSVSWRSTEPASPGPLGAPLHCHPPPPPSGQLRHGGARFTSNAPPTAF